MNSERAAAAEQVPQNLPKRQLPLLLQDGAVHEPGPYLANECGSLAAGFGAVGRPGRGRRVVAIRAGAGVGREGASGVGGGRIQYKAKNGPRLLLDIVWIGRQS